MNRFLTKHLCIVLTASIIFILIGFFIRENIILEVNPKCTGYIIFGLILPKFAELAFAGGIITILTSNNEILETYRTELIDIVHDSKLLKYRSNIGNIWINVTKALLKQRFNDIHSDLLPILKSQIPNNDVSYYRNYDISHDIKWYDKDAGLIDVIETTSIEIIADNNEEFIFNQNSSIDIKPEQANDCYIHMENDSIKVNGISVKCDVNNNDTKKSKKHTLTLKLKDSQIYKIEKVMEKRYNIYHDPILGFRAKYMTRNIDVIFHLPSDLELFFAENGVPNAFEFRKIGDNSCKYKYNGLFLPKQGYTAFIKPKLTN